MQESCIVKIRSAMKSLLLSASVRVHRPFHIVLEDHPVSHDVTRDRVPGGTSCCRPGMAQSTETSYGQRCDVGTHVHPLKNVIKSQHHASIFL
jgi:hypothetical protein